MPVSTEQKKSELHRGSLRAELLQEPAGRVLMDTRDYHVPFPDPLFNDNCCRFAGSDPLAIVYRENPVAFYCSGIIVIDDGTRAGTGRNRYPPGMAFMLVQD